VGPTGYGRGVLIRTENGESQEIPIAAASRARWTTGNDLIIEQQIGPNERGFGTRVVRADSAGRILEVLSDREGLGHSTPSPSGRWVALQRDGEKAPEGVEVRDLGGGFDVISFHPGPPDPRLSAQAVGIAWKPDESEFAVGLLVPDRDQSGHLIPRIAIATREKPGFRWVVDPWQNDDPATGIGGAAPLFWRTDGIYARSGEELVRCDPAASSCSRCYTAGEGRSIVGGTVIDGDRALVLVRDLERHPVEARAKEVHEVDLTTGRGKVLLRVPGDSFISDIDWIGG
jgi:hypothetical protein